MNRLADQIVELGKTPVTLEQFVELAHGCAKPRIAASALERMAESRRLLLAGSENCDNIYGVSTSVGASVGTAIPLALADEFSTNLYRMHGCGTGRILTETESAAVLVARLCSLVRGLSGVRPEVGLAISKLLSARVLPRIPAEGSVGASGDLTPMSYVAAVLCGEREAYCGGDVVSAEKALEESGLAPIQLERKEALAIMNGTAVASALGVLAWHRAYQLARLAANVTAMIVRAIDGNPEHYDAYIHDAKPHPGQVKVAQWIRDDLSGCDLRQPKRLQDRYSLRCAPHVIGVLVDALGFTKGILETELNGVSDNPLVDTASERVLHGGNFYGGHVGFAFDMLKTAVANVACLMDRQMNLLCNPAENGDLPTDLVGVTGDHACAHNGFKAVTIAASSLAAEALKLTMPASAFSRSTENHNQDKVPMATIASRDLTRIVTLSEQLAAMLTLAACQALDLAGVEGGKGGPWTGEALRQKVRETVPMLEADRRLDLDIARVHTLLATGELTVGGIDLP